MMILGFDPGKDKCGLAIMGNDAQIYYHETIASEEVLEKIKALTEEFSLNLLVMGNQTTAKQWKSKLEELALSIPIKLVDERNSSLEARDRYWELYPPRGLKRLIPQGMRLPPCPIDDIVAIILIERYLGN